MMRPNAGREPHGQPLHGIRILDFTTLLPGPLATLMLAQAGAEVTKIERPGGDDMRRLGPRLPSGESAAFAALNRGKRMLTLDLREARDAQTARDLVADTDVLVEQNRPGAMTRLGFGYRQLIELNPRLIYCSITGYGQSGPRAQRAGHDVNYLADAGVLMNVAGAGGEPMLPPALLADIGGGALPAALNILLALRQRDRTGAGCHVDIAMTDCVMAFQVFAFADVLACGRAAPPNSGPLTGASPRYRLYQAGDGRWLAVGALEEKFWRTFCDVIGLTDELRDDSLEPAATTAEVATLLRLKSAAEWLQDFEGRDACVSLVRSLDEALAGPSSRTSRPSALPLPLHHEFCLQHDQS